MGDAEWIRRQQQEHEARLRALAYRMLGSRTDADDALQETWMRVLRADTSEVVNPGGWLTTMTARVCLNMLRARRSRPEPTESLVLPDPIVTRADVAPTPEEHAVLADSIGLALMVVMDTLDPAERLAFVLHDVFAVPFDDIAPIVDRTPDATRQLASRARRKVRAADVIPDDDTHAQRKVVDGFFAAARNGDLDALVALLHPDVSLRGDGGRAIPAATHRVEGAAGVAQQAMMFSRPDAMLEPVFVNGVVGTLVWVGDRPVALMSFVVRDGLITEIDGLADPGRVAAAIGPAIKDAR
jgi:RNA polymerase sigma-70 factor (ECF subfamily)